MGTAVTTTAVISTTLACCLSISCCKSCGGEVLLAVLLTVANPNLDAEATNLGVCYCESVVDVCTEGVERGTTLFEHL